MIDPHSLTQIDRYPVEAYRAEGGFSWVFEVQDTTLGVKRALKLLKPEAAQGDEFLRFEREARLIASLDHDNLIRVFDFGRDEGTGCFFYTMKWIEGVRLSETRPGWVAAADETVVASTLTTVREACEYLLQVVQGVAVLHAHGIIHRDIKPGNIFLDRDSSGRVRPVVADLGLAKAENDDAGATRTRGVMGTPLYMSPEQARAEPSSPATDVFSLGLTMYRVLTGRHIYEDEEDVDSLNSQNVLAHLATLHYMQAEFRFRFPNEIPPAVCEVIRRACRMTPTQRFADAGEMARALSAALQAPEAQPAAAATAGGAGAASQRLESARRPRASSEPTGPGDTPTPHAGGGLPAWLAYAGGALALGLAVVALWFLTADPEPDPGATSPERAERSAPSARDTLAFQRRAAESARSGARADLAFAPYRAGFDDAQATFARAEQAADAGDRREAEALFQQAEQAFLEAASIARAVQARERVDGIAEDPLWLPERLSRSLDAAGAEFDAGRYVQAARGFEALLEPLQEWRNRADPVLDTLAETRRQRAAALERGVSERALSAADAARDAGLKALREQSLRSASLELAKAQDAYRSAGTRRAAATPPKPAPRPAARPKPKPAPPPKPAAVRPPPPAPAKPAPPAEPPRLTETWPDARDLEIAPDATIEFRAEAAGPDLTLVWQVDGTPVGEGERFLFEPEGPGLRRVRVLATDARGRASSPREWAVRVAGARPRPPPPAAPDDETLVRRALRSWNRAFNRGRLEQLARLHALSAEERQQYRLWMLDGAERRVTVESVQPDGAGYRAELRIEQSTPDGDLIHRSQWNAVARLARSGDGWVIQKLERR